MDIPEVSQEEFAQELLSETLQKVALLEQQNLHLRLQIRKLQESASVKDTDEVLSS